MSIESKIVPPIVKALEHAATRIPQGLAHAHARAGKHLHEVADAIEGVDKKESKLDITAPGSRAPHSDGGSTVRGTNERGKLTSRSSFRKPVTRSSWDDAAPGPMGGRLCPTCKTEVHVAPFTGQPLDWDRSHIPSWSKREFPSDSIRADIRDNYNEGVKLECVFCNRSRGNRDERLEP